MKQGKQRYNETIMKTTDKKNKSKLWFYYYLPTYNVCCIGENLV